MTVDIVADEYATTDIFMYIPARKSLIGLRKMASTSTSNHYVCAKTHQLKRILHMFAVGNYV